MLTNKDLFHSETKPVPPIRRDIQIIPIEDSGKELLYFHDSMGYLSNNFALDANVYPILHYFDGEQNIQSIHHSINGQISLQGLKDFVQLLDQHRALQSDYFHFCADQIEEDFEKKQVREPMLAGQSYPEHPDEVESFVMEMLQTHHSHDKPSVQALFAPHIEISIGKKQYGEAFSYLQHKTPKRVVILATSHYSSYYYKHYDGFPFIGSNKSYRMPGKTISTDHEVIEALSENSSNNGFTTKDRAHRIEHSIEFHLLFASTIWNHDFKIVPILISGFDDLYYSESGDLVHKIDAFTSQLKSFVDNDTMILISGDLSHVGQKFGDAEPAVSLRESVEQSDKQFLDISVEGKPEKILNHLKKDYDSTRVCGFPPLYTYLKMFPEKKGELLNYYWWDEKERNSAVSFGSILY